MRVLFCLAVLMMFACGGGEEAPSAPAETPSAAPSQPAPTTPPPTAPAPTTPPATAPATPPPAVPTATGPRTPGHPSPEALAKVPSGNLRGDPKRGGTLYTQYCSTCHGATGHGDGPLAASLNPKPANHTDASYMGQLSDEYIWVVVTQGAAAIGKSPLMAPWGAVLTQQDTKDVLAYVRTLSGT